MTEHEALHLTDLDQREVSTPKEGGAAKFGQTIRERREDIRRDTRALANDLGALVSELEQVSRQQTVERPYLTLGLCFAAGYVLGGGLPGGVIRFAAMTGGRMVVTSLVRDTLDARYGATD